MRFAIAACPECGEPPACTGDSPGPLLLAFDVPKQFPPGLEGAVLQLQRALPGHHWPLCQGGGRLHRHDAYGPEHPWRAPGNHPHSPPKFNSQLGPVQVGRSRSHLVLSPSLDYWGMEFVLANPLVKCGCDN